jgi:DNA helicase-2/ATP-dependent DNA helicase PcrA
MRNLEELKATIIESHKDDLQQQDVIFAPEPRILVEAPAGYGKTHTMISKIAYILASGQISGYKKILALTFSINAAHKIRKDVEEKLPNLLENVRTGSKNKIVAKNYHGFCINILQKYGYLLHESLREVEKLEKIDITLRNFRNYVNITSYDNLQNCILKFDNEVKFYFDNQDSSKVRRARFSNLLNNYNHLIINQFLPKGKITYNSIISLTIELFTKYPNIKNFYSKYFPFIIVDEYQDTNILNFRLLNSIITDSSKLLFMGDSMQRIYGFIGAIPDLLPVSAKYYSMKLIELEKNYRFADSPLLLEIDSFLRKKYKNFEYTANIEGIENIIIEATKQEEESEKIIELLSTINKEEKTVILFKQRGQNANFTINSLDQNNIKYFYAIFSEEDRDYLNFHEVALSLYLEVRENKKYKTYIDKKNYILKKLRENFQDEIKNNLVISSLYKLIKVFFNQTQSHADRQERYEIILEVLKNNTLKHYLNSVKENLILSTIHGAKGLEWDNVILPDVEAKTSCWALCSAPCDSRNNATCVINPDQLKDRKFKKILLEELSTFYVGITRAKKNIYFTYSNYSYDNFGNYLNSGASCLLKMLFNEDI